METNLGYSNKMNESIDLTLRKIFLSELKPELKFEDTRDYEQKFSKADNPLLSKDRITIMLDRALGPRTTTCLNSNRYIDYDEDWYKVFGVGKSNPSDFGYTDVDGIRNCDCCSKQLNPLNSNYWLCDDCNTFEQNPFIL